MFPDSPLLNGVFIFIIGVIVVFAGMYLIILCVKLAGKIFDSTSKPKTVVTEKTAEPEPAVVDDEIPDEIKVAIIAAITGYYFTEQKSKCDFVVKRIKRL